MFTLAGLLRYLHGADVPGASDVQIASVCVDSRQARRGSLFAAFRGERVDGHDYVSSAFENGATVALVERPLAGAPVIDLVAGIVPDGVTLPIQVRVANTLQALQDMAQAHRAFNSRLNVVAVTGSVGKTTTKEAIASVLAQGFATLKSEGNQNNEIGLPLTLLRLEPGHTHVVLEMGMYALGEIADLCRIAQPTIGVVTNVGPVHLERLGTIERIAQAKAELVTALPQAGLVVLNGDDARVLDMAGKTSARCATFGLGQENTVRADSITVQELDGVEFTVHVSGDSDLGLQPTVRRIALPVPGKHMVMAALPAIAVGLVAGLSWEAIGAGLDGLGSGVRLVPKAGVGGVRLLDDTYNASPQSTMAALDVLALCRGRRVAVLADMLELGPLEEQGHLETGRYCAGRVDLLVTVGARARSIAKGARQAGFDVSAVHVMGDKAQAIQLLRSNLLPGDTVLIKGSRSMEMEEIVITLGGQTL